MDHTAPPINYSNEELDSFLSDILEHANTQEVSNGTQASTPILPENQESQISNAPQQDFYSSVQPVNYIVNDNGPTITSPHDHSASQRPAKTKSTAKSTMVGQRSACYPRYITWPPTISQQAKGLIDKWSYYSVVGRPALASNSRRTIVLSEIIYTQVRFSTIATEGADLCCTSSLRVYPAVLYGFQGMSFTQITWIRSSNICAIWQNSGRDDGLLYFGPNGSRAVLGVHSGAVPSGCERSLRLSTPCGWRTSHASIRWFVCVLFSWLVFVCGFLCFVCVCVFFVWFLFDEWLADLGHPCAVLAHQRVKALLDKARQGIEVGSERERMVPLQVLRRNPGPGPWNI